MTIDRKNLAVGLIYLGVAAAAGVTASGYGLGTLQRMAPGYFPLLAAAGLGIVGLIITAKALMPAVAVEEWGHWDLRPALAVCGATALFALLLKPAGLAISIVVLIAVANLGNRDRSWKMTALSLAVLVPMSWAIFTLLLNLPLTLLPAGWGI